MISERGRSPDPVLLTAVIALCFIGLMMVFSSSPVMAESRYNTPYVFTIKQAAWMAIGFVLMAVVQAVPPRMYQRGVRPLYFASLVLVIAVLIIGTVKGGARRWMRLGPLSFQPSELAKLGLIAVIADYIDRRKSQLAHWQGLVPPLALTAALCLPIALEPDLGTPLLMAAVCIVMLYAGGAAPRTLAGLGLVLVPVIALEIWRKPYRLTRMRDFFASWGGIDSASYQLSQSLLAFGSGGPFGRGLGNSHMKLLYLPEPHTDFIFPIIGEELGFLGAAVVVLLFGVVAWRGCVIARRAGDLFSSMLALGLTGLITAQAFFNMSVALGLLPTKGLPLPFISFGGTALVLHLAAIGLLLSISRSALTNGRRA